MNKRKTVLFFSFFTTLGLSLCSCLSGNAQSATGNLTFLSDTTRYLWPSESSPYMSATFGETRAAHFHAALDIKTWGREGYKVFATRDGILHRVGISPTGYGHVIYLKHHDGSYSLYAHLLDFIPRIRSLVDSLRMQNFTFEFDENLESYNIHFQKGEVIGYTGSSGVGPPHLHFELRTPDYRPFNPLLTNLDIDDSRPPRFSGLSVEPLSADARIEGEPRIITQKPRWRNGYFDFGTIDVAGTVGLGVDVFDQANGVSNVYAAYELTLKMDNEVLFHSKIDSFSYDNTHQMFIDRVYPILKETRQGYQRLYVADGNTLPFYADGSDQGKLRLPSGTHQLIIEAADYHGNSSKARVSLHVNSIEHDDKKQQPQWNYHPPEKLLTSSTAAEKPLLWYNDWFIVKPNLTTTVRSLSAFSFSTPYLPATGVTAIPTNKMQDQLIQFSDSSSLILHRLTPQNEMVILSPDQRLNLHIPKNAVYDSLSIGLTYETLSDSIRIEVFPHAEPLREKMTLELVLDTTEISFKNPVIFWHNKRKNSLYYQETELNGQIVSSKLESFGTHYVIDDTAAPEMQRPILRKGIRGNWYIAVEISDPLSGVDHQSARFFCNEKRGIAEYDPESDRLIYYRPGFQPQDENHCQVTVADRAGNRKVFSFSIAAH